MSVAIQPPSIASVIRPQSNTPDDDQIPTSALLSFPPFPKHPGASLASFAGWQGHGVWLETSSSHPGTTDALLTPKGRDTWGNALVDVGESSTMADRSYRHEDKSLKRLTKPASRMRLARQDCFRIGVKGDDWKEPFETSRSDYDMLVTKTELCLPLVRFRPSPDVSCSTVAIDLIVSHFGHSGLSLLPP
jgi:hypothetical protein